MPFSPIALAPLLGLARAEPDVAVDDPAPEPPAVVAGFWAESLPNGMRVAVLSDPDAPVVATQIWVQVGSAHEAPSELGFAHLFEHLMFGATKSHGKEDYARLHTVNGGEENAYTAWDNTVYLSQIQPSAHDAVLVLEADRFRDLILDQDNLDNEKKIVTEELRLRTENNPMSRVLVHGVEQLFAGHPYGHFPSGTKEDIANADLELCRKFYAGYYRPQNLDLVVVGPVNGPATIARVKELFSDTGGDALTPPAVPTLVSHGFPDLLVMKDDIPPVKVAALFYPLPPSTDASYPAARLLGQMLAGNQVDRFRQVLVEQQGKALDAFTLSEDLRAGGLLAFGSVSLPFRGDKKALKLLQGAVDTLDEGAWLTQENLDISRRFLLREELERAWYADRRADAIGQAWSWRGDEQGALGGDVEALKAVSLDDVKAVWTQWVAQKSPTHIIAKRGKPE